MSLIFEVPFSILGPETFYSDFRDFPKSVQASSMVVQETATRTHPSGYLKSRGFPVHALKPYGGSCSLSPLILNLGSTRRPVPRIFNSLFTSLHIYIYIHTHTHTHTHIYRVSQEKSARLRESVPYVKL